LKEYNGSDSIQNSRIVIDEVTEIYSGFFRQLPSSLRSLSRAASFSLVINYLVLSVHLKSREGEHCPLRTVSWFRVPN
jgi:hypothetical protein